MKTRSIRLLLEPKLATISLARCASFGRSEGEECHVHLLHAAGPQEQGLRCVLGKSCEGAELTKGRAMYERRDLHLRA